MPFSYFKWTFSLTMMELMLEQYLLFFWKRKFVLFINFVVVLFAAYFFAWHVAKKEFRAQTTFLPPTAESSSPLAIMGIALPSLAGGSIQTEQIVTIFNSRALKRRLIEQFNLYVMFKLTKSINKFEMALRQLETYVMLEGAEKGSMGFEKTLSYTITCYHPSPDTARMMADYTFSLLDSSVKRISMSRAFRNRQFIEKQLARHKMTLDSLQNSFEVFQVDNKAYVVPEQMRLSLKSYAELKSASIVNDLKLKALEREFVKGLPEIEELQRTARLYNEKLSAMESDGSPSVIPSLSISSKLLPLYSNFMRETEVQTEVILMLERELEQARLQESKDVSSLVIIDPAYVPEYKSRPKRLHLLGLLLIIEHFFVILLFSYQFFFATVIMHNTHVQQFLQAIKSDK
jgi:tyrosine-protein kinase Etk/Wzc